MNRILKTSFFMAAFVSFAIAEPNQTPAKAKAPAQTSQKEDRIVAKINTSIIIRESDVDKAMSAMPQKELAAIPASKKEKIRALVLQQVVVTKLMREAAKKSGIERDPLYKRMLNEKKEELMVNVYMNNALKARLTPANVMTKVATIEKEFENQLERKVCMIAVKDDETANKAIADLDSGKDFAETAKKYSVFPTEDAKLKAAEGMYLIVEQAVLFPEDVKAAITKLKANEYTKSPLAIGGSKFIVKVSDIRKAVISKEEIVQIAQQRLIQEEMKKLVDTVKAKNKISYYNEDGIEVQPENVSPEDLLKN